MNLVPAVVDWRRHAAKVFSQNVMTMSRKHCWSQKNNFTTPHLGLSCLHSLVLSWWILWMPLFWNSPLGDTRCISRAIIEKIDALKRVGEKFMDLSAHDALL